MSPARHYGEPPIERPAFDPRTNPDPLTVDDRVPVHERIPETHPKRYQVGSKRRGCISVIGFLAIAIAILAVAVPRSAHVIPAVSFEEASGNRGLSGAPQPVNRGAPSLPAASTVTEPLSGYGSGTPVQSTPAPSASIGTGLFSASATWCAPTPTQCRRWGGHALLAALPTYSGVPYRVRVRFGERHVDVTVVSICGCGIDLSPFAFEKLAPLSRGRIPVEVEGPIAPLPATDVVP